MILFRQIKNVAIFVIKNSIETNLLLETVRNIFRCYNFPFVSRVVK